MLKQPPGVHFEFPILAKLHPYGFFYPIFILCYDIPYTNLHTKFRKNPEQIQMYIVFMLKQPPDGHFEFPILTKLHPYLNHGAEEANVSFTLKNSRKNACQWPF
jgi:hypothetical protein